MQGASIVRRGFPAAAGAIGRGSLDRIFQIVVAFYAAVREVEEGPSGGLALGLGVDGEEPLADAVANLPPCVDADGVGGQAKGLRHHRRRHGQEQPGPREPRHGRVHPERVQGGAGNRVGCCEDGRGMDTVSRYWWEVSRLILFSRRRRYCSRPRGLVLRPAPARELGRGGIRGMRGPGGGAVGWACGGSGKRGLEESGCGRRNSPTSSVTPHAKQQHHPCRPVG